MGETNLVGGQVVAGVELKAVLRDGKLVLEADLSPKVLLDMLKNAIPGKIDDAIIDALELAVGAA